MAAASSKQAPLISLFLQTVLDTCMLDRLTEPCLLTSLERETICLGERICRAALRLAVAASTQLEKANKVLWAV